MSGQRDDPKSEGQISEELYPLSAGVAGGLQEPSRAYAPIFGPAGLTNQLLTLAQQVKLQRFGKMNILVGHRGGSWSSGDRGGTQKTATSNLCIIRMTPGSALMRRIEALHPEVRVDPSLLARLPFAR